VVKLVPIEEECASTSVWDTVEEARARYGALDVDFILPQRSELKREDPLD
jgi:hypothetical protein